METAVPVEGWPVVYEPVRYPSGVVSRVGGVGFNVAAGLAGLGRRVRLAGFVGSDVLGAVVERALWARGLWGPTLVRAGVTPQSVVLYDPAGRRQVHTDLKDLPEAVFPVEVFAEALDGAAWAVLTNIGFARPLLEVARSRGVPVAADVHAIDRIDDGYNAAWMAAEVLFCSHERLPCSPEQWARTVLDRYGCAVVVVGLGAGGVLVAECGARVFRVPAVAPRPVVNTVGAGDALAAAFLHCYAATGDARAAAEQAVVFAGWKIGASADEDGFLDPGALAALTQATFDTATSVDNPSSR